ncbi:MAG: glycosyltransferase family 39 protein [Phycisphaerae bacterium]|jgi:hypothetical protein
MWLLRRPTIVVLLCASVVHAGLLAVVYARAGRIDAHAFESVDCGEYYNIARNVAERGVFSQRADEPFVPDTWRTPGYPFLLAVFIFLLGDAPAGLVIVQQALAILNVVLLFRLATNWMSERRAVVLAVLFLLEPYHLKYSIWLMSATWFVTVLLLSWHCWQRTLRTGRWSWAVLLGGLCGFFVLVRPVGLLVPVVVFAGLVFDLVRRRRNAARATTPPGGVLPLAVFAVACLAVIGSWMVRNHRVTGHLALSNQGGVVLAYFKAAEVDLWREGRNRDRYLETTLDPARLDRPHRAWEKIDAALREQLAHLPVEQRETLTWQNLAQGVSTPVDSFLVSKTLARIGRRRLAESPVSTVTCCLVRFGSILTFPLCLAVTPPNGVELSRVLSFVKGALYLVLCGAVVLRLFRGRIGFATGYFPIACTLALLLATTPQLDPRFRVPMIPVLLLLALLPLRPGGSEPEPSRKSDADRPGPAHA